MKKKCSKCGTEYENDNTLCPLDGGVLLKIDDAADALVGQTLSGKYRVEERINEGGMGTVYRATHVLMDKTVALKVLRPTLAADDKIVQRFTREARAASRISHPHALNVTDFGEAENGVVFLVMEYLRGRTLKEVVRAEAPLAAVRVVDITRQICGALDAAHAEGVVHRDLKSDNIMLEELGTHHDWAKVLDFGIAKIQEPIGQDLELTAPNLVIGTPYYMSPEQCSQSPDIDARSDIYSLGVIIYEMLVGHVPFTGSAPTTIMMKHLQDAPPSVLTERPDLPAAVDEAVQRALAKRPEDRYESAGQLAEALAAALAVDTATAVGANAVAAAGTDVGGQVTGNVAMLTAASEAARVTSNIDYTEATVVQQTSTEKEDGAIGSTASEFVPPPVVTSPSSNFNPWRIAMLGAALMIASFAVLYAIQGTSPTRNDERPLASDPNSQPVQPGAPPTGASERNIAPSAPIAAASVPVAAATTAASTSGTGNANASSTTVGTGLEYPTVIDGITTTTSTGTSATITNRNTNPNREASVVESTGSGTASETSPQAGAPAVEREAERTRPSKGTTRTDADNEEDAPPPPPRTTSPSPRQQASPRPSTRPESPQVVLPAPAAPSVPDR